MAATYLIYFLVPVGVGGFIWAVRKWRERQWGWVQSKDSLRDRTYIITGANTGLGFEATRDLIARNATVIMACRNMNKAQEAIMRIEALTTSCEGKMIPVELNLASFASIHRFADVIKRNYPHFDCLINNAGLAVKEPQFTEEGYEVHFGVNHLGPFLLTNLLAEEIRQNNARVVIVASKMHERGQIDFENLGKWTDAAVVANNPYYNNSKLCNFYFARELYKRDFDVHVLCPGLCNTDFFRAYNPRWYHYVLFAPVAWLWLRSAHQGAQNIVHCATDNENTVTMNPATNYIVRDLKQTKSKAYIDEEISEKLWTVSEEMCKLKAE